METKTIGAFIARLRKEKGMTQKELAGLLRVSDKTVSRWEREESLPDLNLVPVLAEIFGVTVDELLRGERSASAPTPVQVSAPQPGEKQLQRILQEIETRYLTRSIISVGLAFGGLAAGLVLAFGPSGRFYGLSLLVGLMMDLLALVHQTVYTSLAFTSLGREELPEGMVAAVRERLVKRAMGAFSLILVLLVALIVSADSSLGFVEWLLFGALWCALAAVVCRIICGILWRALRKKAWF